MRAIIGIISAALASLLSIYIVLVILKIAPQFSISIFNESFIKFIAQLTVFFYLLAAWACWHL